MANSADTTSGKCFSGVLRRLLCSGSLPTHPSDQFVDPNGEKNPERSVKHDEADLKQGAATTPGVVARLMGLDSFPSTPLAPTDKTLGSFFRSRSVNSIDFLSHLDPIKQGHHSQHRRVRTSVSFREGITNDDYNSTSVILRLEKVDETAECEPEMLIRRRKRISESRIMNKEDRSRNGEKVQERRGANKPIKRVEMMNQKKSSQKMDLHGKTRHGFKETRQIMNSNKEELRKNSKCLETKKNTILGQRVHSGCRMKKVHPQEVCSRNNVPSKIGKSDRSPYSSGGAHSSHIGEIRAITKGKNQRKTKSRESCYYKRMAEEICRLADEDVKENWMHGLPLEFENFEDMCQQFGQEILQVLLEQFVDELVLLYGTRE